MNAEKENEGNLSEEFRKLGKNLVDAAQSAWESPERKKLQGEIEKGLLEFQGAMKEEIDHWRESPAAQRVKEDIKDAGERVRSSEIEKNIREELLVALQSANRELEKIASRWTSSEEVIEETASEPQEETQQTEAQDD